ncbi:sigma-54 dependent transcriptional regulator [Deferribacterales bacterium Es71-Z0220]|uniref:sigma-54-dependent transcriptional regulator n=1 Tax=Deferrivibrio essentukiensis TaxID=2880922 RepID=UPI001F60AD7E|nr:sigma-54 dependent transcriptional regulator [Deferrivibrio essentukiensis]MCB4204141.1 sigma-54 dependent transcriptional regulator [Deferrivibrio essentukiensis]
MKILIIDDEVNICTTIKDILEDEGYSADFSINFSEGFQKLKSQLYDVVFLDIWLPDKDGVIGLQEIKSYFPEIEVVMISGHGNIENAVESIKFGAYDFLEKPLSLDRILLVIKNLKDKIELTQHIKEYKLDYLKKYDLLGNSPQIKELRAKIEKIAQTNARVLITGENGTGKEHVARLIHLLSKRSSKRFVEINCSAIPSELMESEMFGYEAGAFTGALNDKIGLFEAADKGTIFLDEIGDMDINLQAKLLRVLETGEFTRVGSIKTIKSDFRLITATNKNLEDEISANNFREDLYYRISVVPIHVPPLRERKTDIPVLIEHFINEACVTNGIEKKTIDKGLLEKMINYSWPGNVRQLKNAVERMVVLSDSSIITLNDAPPFLTEANNQQSKLNIEDLMAEFYPLKHAKDIFEKDYIEKVLELTGWNISKASKILEIERTYLHKKIKHFQISKE